MKIQKVQGLGGEGQSQEDAGQNSRRVLTANNLAERLGCRTEKNKKESVTEH